MDAEKLTALRDALGMFLGLDDEIRRALVGLIAEPPAKPEPVHRGNGADPDRHHHPPQRQPQPAPAMKPRGSKKPTPQEVQEAEQRLLDVLRDHPGGIGTTAVAKATGANLSTTVERAKRLQARGLIEKDDDAGHWRLTAKESATANPTRPSPAA
jgi:hypothetical protein